MQPAALEGFSRMTSTEKALDYMYECRHKYEESVGGICHKNVIIFTQERSVRAEARIGLALSWSHPALPRLPHGDLCGPKVKSYDPNSQ